MSNKSHDVNPPKEEAQMRDVNPATGKIEPAQELESYTIVAEDIELYPALETQRQLKVGDIIQVPKGRLQEFLESTLEDNLGNTSNDEDDEEEEETKEEKKARLKAEKEAAKEAEKAKVVSHYVFSCNVTHNGQRYNKGDRCSDDAAACEKLVAKKLAEPIYS
jgi:hypothetical protein